MNRITLPIEAPFNDENSHDGINSLKSFENSPSYQLQNHHQQYSPRSSSKSQYDSRPTTKKSTTQSKSNSMKIGPRIKKSAAVVLIGDSNCGKTSLVLTYINKKFSTAPKSILFETYDKSISFANNLVVDLQIWDFPGDEYFDRFRPLGYANAKGILICFTLDRLETLHHVEERWIPEIETHCPNVVKIIVGIGSEVRYDRTKVDKVPAFDYCYKYAKKLGCKYMECSLVDKDSYIKVFKQLALLSTSSLPSAESSCSPQKLNQLVIPKIRTNTMTNILYLDDEQPKARDPDPKQRVTSYKKKKSLIGCTIV